MGAGSAAARERRGSGGRASISRADSSMIGAAAEARWIEDAEVTQIAQNDPAAKAAPERRAIVMLSAGDRPWLGGTSKTFSFYAAKCGAAFHVERDLPSLADFPLAPLPDAPGRANKRAYACKAYFVWKYLASGYDRVLFVDDACCVGSNAPNVFDVSPVGSIAGCRTSAKHAEITFRRIAHFVRRRSKSEVPFVADDYMNGGVLLYDRSMTSALAPDKIIDAQFLLLARFPHQTLLYYLMKSAGVPAHCLPRNYNTIPAVRLPLEQRREMDDIAPYLEAGAFIFHVTSVHRNRKLLIDQVADHCLQGWEGSRFAAPHVRASAAAG